MVNGSWRTDRWSDRRWQNAPVICCLCCYSNCHHVLSIADKPFFTPLPQQFLLFLLSICSPCLQDVSKKMSMDLDEGPDVGQGKSLFVLRTVGILDHSFIFYKNVKKGILQNVDSDSEYGFRVPVDCIEQSFELRPLTTL